jgi:hypothetical protein
MKEETFVGLLHATREQLRDEPTREVEPRKVAMLAGIAPFRMQYAEAVGYLLDHGYIEEYPNHPHGLYRVTNKGLEEILKNPQNPSRQDTPPRW